MGLRPYQQAAIERTRADFNAGIERLLVVMATGLGKTVCICNIPTWFPGKRSLVMVHTDELCIQAKESMERFNPGLRVGVEMGSRYADDSDDVIIASPQTLGRSGSSRIGKFRPDDFGSMILDECHHGTSDSYIRVLEHFGFMSGKKTGRLLYGTTATPDRSDGVGLSKIFDKISYNYGLLDAIRDGWLCNLRGVRIKTSTNLDDVRTSGEDFNLTDLSLAVNTPERNRLVVEQWLKAGERRKTLGFSAGVQHAKDLAAAFRAQGVKAQAVWGEDNDRKQKIADHKSGAIEVLLNDSLLTEGYDDRSIECVLLARPVRSKLRYQQMLGRGTRLPHGVDNLFEAQRAGLSISKMDCLVLDLSDSTTKHSLVGLPTLFGLPEKLDCSGFPITEAIEKIEEIKKKNPDVDLSNLEDVKNITTYLEHIDLFNVKYAPEVIENSALQWHRSSEGKYVLLLPSNENVTIAENLIGKYEIRGVVNGNEFEDSVGALSDAFNCADSMVKYLGGRTILSMVKRDASKKKSSEPMTPKQKRALAFQFYKRGKAVPNLDGMSKHAASKLLSKLYAGQ